MNGLVICSHPLAAQAGAGILRAGGNAVDAAIGVALSLCVVDPANCGFAGYGGYMTVKNANQDDAWVVDFNTILAQDFDPREIGLASRCGPFINGERSIALPMVASGLAAAQREFGTLNMSDLARTALTLAREGFAVDANLAKALRWTEKRSNLFGADFNRIFCPQGRALREDERLVQSDLADTLDEFVADPAAFFESRAFSRVKRHMEVNGVARWTEVCLQAQASVKKAIAWHGPGFSVFGPSLEESGFGILLPALQHYVEEKDGPQEAWSPDAFVNGLKDAWAQRAAATATPEAVTKHTTHFSVLDRTGTLVSCTFTHGPLWFGSGVVAPDTGLVMNCGMNLARYSRVRNRWAAVNNLTPVVVETALGARYCMGAPGGSRIPAIALKLLIETVMGGAALDDAINWPRVSVSPQGEIEAEIDANWPGAHRVLGPEEFYGPASAIGVLRGGVVVAAVDRRCASGVATV